MILNDYFYQLGRQKKLSFSQNFPIKACISCRVALLRTREGIKDENPKNLDRDPSIYLYGL